jgi:hypothetical protein
MFSTRNTGVGMVDAMTITGPGYVGIGTTDPKANLQVTSSAFPVLKVADNLGGGAIALGDSTISSNYVGIWRGAANSISGGGFLNVQGNNIAFMSTDAVFGSATRTMTLTNTGNLGVGVTSPAARLDVTTSTAGFAAILTNTNGASDSNGLNIRSGTVSTEYNLRLSNTSNTADFMVVKGNGNVGIGISSPTEKLMVVGPIVVSGQLQGLRADSSTLDFTPTEKYTRIIATGPDSSTYASIIFATTTTTTYAERMRITSEGNVGIGTTIPATKLQLGDGSSGQLKFRIHRGAGTDYTDYFSDTGSTIVDTVGGGSFILRFGGTEKLQLTASGDLLIGNTSALTQVARATFVNSGGNAVVALCGNSSTAYQSTNTSGTAQYYGAIWSNNGNTFSTCGYVSVSGTTTSYVTSSDYRLKENVQPLTGALDKVAQLKPVTYKWKSDGTDGEGFIAHELAEVCPQAVSGEKDGLKADGSIMPQGVDTSFLVATLTAAIQEQQALIESMATKLKDAGVAGF